jgi:XisH protein
LEQALGQYILYQQIIGESGIDRVLYLAVSETTFKGIFSVEIGQVLLKNGIVRLIVFDDEKEEITRWMPL